MIICHVGPVLLRIVLFCTLSMPFHVVYKITQSHLAHFTQDGKCMRQMKDNSRAGDDGGDSEASLKKDKPVSPDFQLLSWSLHRIFKSSHDAFCHWWFCKRWKCFKSGILLFSFSNSLLTLQWSRSCDWKLGPRPTSHHLAAFEVWRHVPSPS